MSRLLVLVGLSNTGVGVKTYHEQPNLRVLGGTWEAIAPPSERADTEDCGRTHCLKTGLAGRTSFAEGACFQLAGSFGGGGAASGAFQNSISEDVGEGGSKEPVSGGDK
ncbi:hypothetical protein MPER_04306 [Moniliophthora perniciosa FA553]|nr:hypothetical protein MPER_04306 [Moniliophthora perniciosa FA553]